MERYGMNEQSAKEWLTKSWHNLSTAKLLYNANHYTDIIAVELHYSSEKTMKSILAFQNKKLPKTHKLFEIHLEIVEIIDLTEYVDLLEQISKYHIEESYPAFNRPLPSREEIKEVLDFAENLFTKVCDILKINKEEIMR